MVEQERNSKGRFKQKSDEFRQVRSIRVTDEVWDKLGKLADQRRITRADLLEELVEEQERLSEAIQILEEALTLKANAGGAIKSKIRNALKKIKKNC